MHTSRTSSRESRYCSLFKAYNFGMALAAQHRTYDDGSLAHFCIAIIINGATAWTLMPHMARKAHARTNGLKSIKSFWNVLTDNKASSGRLYKINYYQKAVTKNTHKF